MKPRPDCAIERLVSIVETLRGPNGCPWDIAQTTESLRPYLLEECHEFLDAVERGETGEIRDELGDLLLQIILHARIFEEQGRFNLGDAAASISDKLVRRHPHVFDRPFGAADIDLERQWEEIKLSERWGGGRAPALFEQVDTDLPPLQLSQKLSRKAARVGLDWPDAAGIFAKIREELDELEEATRQQQPDAVQHEVGDLLFSVVNLARYLDVDAELALRRNNMRFVGRVRTIEAKLSAQGRTFSDCHPAELDHLWAAAKQKEQEEKAT